MMRTPLKVTSWQPPDLNTLEREDAADAVAQLIATVDQVDLASALGWFDDTRDF
jgi:hypothetical protein